MADKVSIEISETGAKLSAEGSGVERLAEDEIRQRWDRDIGQTLAVEKRVPMERNSVDRHMGGEGWVVKNYRSLILLKDLGLVDFKSQLDDDEFLTVYLTPLGDEFVSVCGGGSQ